MIFFQINLFMSSDKKVKDEQNENDNAIDDRSASKDVPKAPSSSSPETKRTTTEMPSSNSGCEQPDKSKMDQAAKLDINLSPEIIIFMKVR